MKNNNKKSQKANGDRSAGKINSHKKKKKQKRVKEKDAGKMKQYNNISKKKTVNKKKKNKPKNKGGRPLFDGKKKGVVIQKLEKVWAIGGSDAEAAFYADISKAALSDYLKKHKDLSERKESLLNKPVLKARQSVVSGLDNSDFALKYLERKRSDEFSLKMKSEFSGGLNNINTDFNIKEEIEKAGYKDSRDFIKDVIAGKLKKRNRAIKKSN